MKTTITLLFALLLLSCSSEQTKDDCPTCNGYFVNFQTGDTQYYFTDCERVPPAPGYVFIECHTGTPSY